MAKRRRRRNREDTIFFGITSRMLMLVAATLLLLSYLSMMVNPAKAWYMTGLGLLFVPIAAVNVILLFWAIKRMSKSFLIPLLALLPSLIFIGRYLQLSSGGEAPSEATVKMVSYNVGRFSLGRKAEFKNAGGNRACMDSVVRFVKKTDADIVCLQEVSLSGEYNVANWLSTHFPGYSASYYMFITDKGSYGNVTLSRFPIVGKGKVAFEHSANQAIYSDIKIGEEMVRVYNCHLESYNISLSALTKSFGRDSSIVKDTEEKMKKSIRIRPQQVEMVMSDIEECPIEAIVAGDFNDNPMSYTYYRLMKRKQDTFVEAGKGFGATYSALWPFIRIDYILLPDSYEAVSCRTPKIKCSDHYPVISEFNVKSE
jgi:Metal-dependent hydrolase